MTSLQSPCHEHPLTPRELSENFSAPCQRCGHPVCGRTHCCLDCNVFFHKWWTEWPLQIQHPSHPQHQVTLVTDNYFTSKYCCHECRFSARAEDLVSTLPPTDEQEEESETVEHFSHEHPLTSFSVTIPNNIRCGACLQDISGLVYGCRRCMFFLHESCTQLDREILQHPFHPKHKLVLVADSNKQFRCNMWSITSVCVSLRGVPDQPWRSISCFSSAPWISAKGCPNDGRPFLSLAPPEILPSQRREKSYDLQSLWAACIRWCIWLSWLHLLPS